MTNSLMPKWQDLSKIFDISSGHLVYKTTRGGVYAGGKAGASTETGYLRCGCTINYIRYDMYAHRIAWIIHHKRNIPKGHDIHHLDGNKQNNNPYNLELRKHTTHVSEHSIAEGNLRVSAYSRSKTGLLGVNYRPDHVSPWLATIFICGKNKNIGSFKSAVKAVQAYWKERMLKTPELSKILKSALRAQLKIARALDNNIAA